MRWPSRGGAWQLVFQSGASALHGGRAAARGFRVAGCGCGGSGAGPAGLAGGMSAATARRVHAMLRSALNAAVRDERFAIGSSLLDRPRDEARCARA
jgi:hypothetical protein